MNQEMNPRIISVSVSLFENTFLETYFVSVDRVSFMSN